MATESFDWMDVPVGSKLAIRVVPGRIEPDGDTNAIVSSKGRIFHASPKPARIKLGDTFREIEAEEVGHYSIFVEVSFISEKGSATVEAEVRKPAGGTMSKKFSAVVAPQEDDRNVFIQLLMKAV